MFKTILKVLLVLIVLAGVGFALGPKENTDTTVSFSPNSIDSDVDEYLAKAESNVKNIKPGAEKQMIWFDPATKQKQLYSIVYLHGFSATLEEIRPVPDVIAQELKANIFYTRYKGHGRDGDAMAEGSLKAWMNDTAEAFAIGRATGEKVIVVATSTGATLASLAAAQPELMKDVYSMVFVAPNYAVQAAGAEVLTFPWARQLVPLVFGSHREWEPKNEGQKKWWSTRYPNVALLPMQAAVSASSNVLVEDISVPVLSIFHPEDGVVKSEVTREIMKRWGKNTKAKAEIFEVQSSDDTMNHVIAGDILSPANTKPVADKAIEWIKSL